jgi:hypothetical protein
MRAYIYDGDEGGVYDECKNLFVDVYRWLTGGIEEYLGSEWYMHLDTNPTNYGVQLWLGKNWWRLNSEYLGESATSEISGCPWTAVHVHQTIWPSFDDEYLQVDKNDQTFVQNGTYDQLDDIDDFIHHWQGWESPP